eukprot:6206177-Pleurochrysis_carterae.AAC.2
MSANASEGVAVRKNAAKLKRGGGLKHATAQAHLVPRRRRVDKREQPVALSASPEDHTRAREQSQLHTLETLALTCKQAASV